MSLLEIEYIIVWLNRFQTKYFDQCTCFLSEVQACLNNFCIIENHQHTRFHIVG